MFERKEFDFGDVKLYLMEFDEFDPSEYLNNLTEIEIEKYMSFSNIIRKREFVATRILRHEVIGFEHIHYDAVGAPYIKGDGFISISHTKNTVGIALAKKFKVGLDIEYINLKIDRIKHKFLSVNELENLDCDSINVLTKIWTAKEALYKLSGRNGINFRTELFLNKIADQNWEGKILENNTLLKVDLNIFEFKNKMISINTSPLEKY